MKKLKPRAYVIISLFLVLSVALVNFLMWPVKNVDVEVNDEVNQHIIHRKIFLITEDNLVVPVTIGFEMRPTLAEELFYVASLMKEDSVIIQDGFTGIFPKETKIHSLTLENTILTVNLSAEFADYQASKEIRILESLAWTFGQYEEINGVKLQVDGIPLTKMPVNKTVIPNPLAKSIGINNHVFFQHYGSQPVTLYYQKNIANSTYYVPTTRRENIPLSDVISIVQLIHEEISPLTGLEPLPVWDKLSIKTNPVFADGTIQFDLGVEALFDETSVNQSLYEALILVFMELDYVDHVSILVEGEAVQVGGYQLPDTVEVADIIFNEVEV